MAWNEQLPQKAAGPWLDDLAARYGFVRPPYITRKAWRRALFVGAESVRGPHNITQGFLEGALSDIAITLTVTLDPSRPSQLVSAAFEFTQDLVMRFVRIEPYGLFRVTGPYDVDDGTMPLGILELCPFATSYWDAADFSALPAQIDVTAEFLGFDIIENQAGPTGQLGDTSGTVTVFVYGDVYGTPPTFLTPPDDLPAPDPGDYPDPPEPIVPDPGDDIPVGMPTPGFLIPDDDAPSGDVAPIYLASDATLSDLGVAVKSLLPTGLKVRFKQFPQYVATVIPWVFGGTAAIVSDGTPGSYAESATDAFARMVFPGGTIASFTVAGWVSSPGGGSQFIGIGDADLTPSLAVFAEGDIVSTGLSDDAVGVGTYVVADPMSGLVHVAVTYDGEFLRFYGNGVSEGPVPFASGAAAAQATTRLLSRIDQLGDGQPGSVRSLAAWPMRLLGPDSFLALTAAGPDHNLFLPYYDEDHDSHYNESGNESPSHWYPAKGDNPSAIIDRGLVGGCNLVGHGGITIGA